MYEDEAHASALSYIPSSIINLGNYKSKLCGSYLYQRCIVDSESAA